MQSAKRARDPSSGPRTGAAGGLRGVLNFQQWGIISVLILLVVVLGVSSPVFLSARNIKNILQQISTLGILSMGTTILMISGGIDLSVGSAVSVVAVIVCKMLKAGIKVRLHKIVFYVMAGFLAGLASPVLSSRISSAIATMGTGFELQSTGTGSGPGAPRSLSVPYPHLLFHFQGAQMRVCSLKEV